MTQEELRRQLQQDRNQYQASAYTQKMRKTWGNSVVEPVIAGYDWEITIKQSRYLYVLKRDCKLITSRQLMRIASARISDGLEPKSKWAASAQIEFLKELADTRDSDLPVERDLIDLLDEMFRESERREEVVLRRNRLD